VVLSGRHWRSPPLVVARRLGDRIAGMRAVPTDHGVLLRTCSVHGFGMDAPLGVVAMDGEGLVRAVRILRPRKLVWLAGTRWIAELPAAWPLPAPGIRLWPERRPLSFGGCPEG
jgi:hypothetical protein